MKISQLYIYPIKSLGGIAVSSVNITTRGFEHDRRWMLIDENNRFLSQREVAEMALLKVSIIPGGLEVHHQDDPNDNLKIRFDENTDQKITVTVWDDQCMALLVSEEADKWFTKKLNTHCRLVYMPDDTQRLIEEKYNINNSITSFSDGFPVLVISEASLQDLNARLTESIAMDRFRPNLVISESKPFEEDNLKEFSINDIFFYGVKPCSRCVITTINQATALKGKEPLTTLASYRNKNHKIYFGENVIAKGTGNIKIGDSITILQTKESLFNQG